LENEFVDEPNFVYRELEENPTFARLMRHTEYNRRQATEICKNLRDSYFRNDENIDTIRKTIREALSGIDLVYLPTYRRIELPLDERETARGGRRRFKLPFGNKGLFTGDIQFGLADIQDRLRELNQQLLADSNLSYREISANIINDLLDSSFDQWQETQKSVPDQKELELFFSRLQQGRRRAGPYSDVAIPNIERIYSGGIPDSTNKFLMYFLSRLNSAIQATRDIEVMAEDFVKICNKYLSRTDSSTSPDFHRHPSPFIENDGKELVLNRRNLNVQVVSTALNRKVPLDSLSSGEKQMISMFAKLYLYNKEKIVLIDEPELSLSIDWQRNIILDILRSSRCKQVVAITHSPFVFDNELEPFARTMLTKIHVSELPTNESDDDLEIHE
ncbi:AAA family ATPase, partial [Aureimonas sp. N4]|uniref:AAA family ATPase n=1 Tax=Aureimonas sp. N4 TaxID=1638165 RepID=UPI000AA785D8